MYATDGCITNNGTKTYLTLRKEDPQTKLYKRWLPAQGCTHGFKALYDINDHSTAHLFCPGPCFRLALRIRVEVAQAKPTISTRDYKVVHFRYTTNSRRDKAAQPYFEQQNHSPKLLAFRFLLVIQIIPHPATSRGTHQLTYETFPARLSVETLDTGNMQ